VKKENDILVKGRKKEKKGYRSFWWIDKKRTRENREKRKKK